MEEQTISQSHAAALMIEALLIADDATASPPGYPLPNGVGGASDLHAQEGTAARNAVVCAPEGCCVTIGARRPTAGADR